MVESLGIVNNGLDEVLRRELRDYRPKKILVDVISSDSLLPGHREYFVLLEINGEKGKRRFLSVYQGGNPEDFLKTQKIRLYEMFACNIETYFEGELYNGPA